MVDVERAIADVVTRDEVVVLPERGMALALAALLEGRDVSVDAVARVVSADPGLAVAALAAAADAAGEAPASLPRALERIGDAALLGLARQAAGGATHGPGPLAARRRTAWRTAAASALVSRELARLRGLDEDAAWLCGLLHDVGESAALAAIERLAAGARVQPAPRRWDALVERWHVSLGLSLAARLRLPREVADVIALHHAGALDPARSPALVRIVRTAAAIARARWDEPLRDEDALALGDVAVDEVDHLAATVARLPAAVSALERGPSNEPRRAPAGTDGADGAALHESKGEGVRLRLAGREYAAVGVARQQLVVSGPAPLGEGALLEVELLERRDLVFHARVLLSWGDGDRFGAILMPFALAGPSTQDWQGRVPVGATA